MSYFIITLDRYLFKVYKQTSKLFETQTGQKPKEHEMKKLVLIASLILLSATLNVVRATEKMWPGQVILDKSRHNPAQLTMLGAVQNQTETEVLFLYQNNWGNVLIRTKIGDTLYLSDQGENLAIQLIKLNPDGSITARYSYPQRDSVN